VNMRRGAGFGFAASAARDIPLLGVILAVLGCGTVSVAVQLTRAPEIDLTQYQQVALAKLDGLAAEDIGARLEKALAEKGGFKVVDLSGSDLTDPEAKRKLGKRLPGAVLIYGKVAESSYHEDVTSERCDARPKVVISGSLDELHELFRPRRFCYTRTAKAVTRVSFEVMDVQTGELLQSKTYAHGLQASDHRSDGPPPALDRGALENATRAAVVEKFLRSIAPHKITIVAPFQTDGALPQLERVAQHAKKGDWDEAREEAQAAVDHCDTHPEIDPRTCAKAHWDLALVFKCTREFDKAVEHVREAQTLSDDEDYLAEIAAIERLRQDQEKLAGDAPAPTEANR